MHRFYYPSLNSKKLTVALRDPDEIHHMRDVLRLKQDSKIILFDGHGKEARGMIKRIKSHEIEIEICDFFNPQKHPTSIILACAIPKKSKFEFIIEKSTECGVSEIIPIITKRTYFALEGKRVEQKMQRFEAIALNAAKQSKRATIPKIRQIISFNNLLKNYRIDEKHKAIIPCLIGSPDNILSVLTQTLPAESLLILIGPEGDFTPKEVTAAIEKGYLPVSLGPTVFKVDTAAICCVALTQLASTNANK